MKLSDRVSIPQEVIARRVGEETVMLDLANGAYFGLDPVGARIWGLLLEGKTLVEVCDAMVNEYDVSRDVLERDVLDLVDKLVKHGLITTA